MKPIPLNLVDIGLIGGNGLAKTAPASEAKERKSATRS